MSDSDADAAVADPEPFVEAEVLPQPDADGERPSELPAAVPDLGVGPPPPPHPARRKESRALPWGPFQLAPIVPASGLVVGALFAGCTGIKVAARRPAKRRSL